MRQNILFFIILSLISFNTIHASENTDLKPISPVSVDDFMSELPDTEKMMPKPKEDLSKNLCFYECTPELSQYQVANQKQLTIFWVQVRGAELNECQCPSTSDVSDQLRCPSKVQGKVAEISMPCQP